jgi:ABC-2 type transport system ATP-binding protein
LFFRPGVERSTNQDPPYDERCQTGLHMLEARGLSKRYGGFLALDRVDFQVRRGEILGYLGPNGSGKSTTVNTVVGLIDPSAGSLWMDGVPISDDPIGYKRRIGYVPEEPHLYTHLTAVEYLMLVGRLRGLSEQTLGEKIPALLKLLLLWDSRYATMAAYSKGMRQRVLFAAALMHNPDLLVLDEPFSGLDVTASLLFRTLLRMYAAGDRMVLFSTHRFDMVEKLCSRVVILSKGRIAAEYDMASFQSQQSRSLEEVFVQTTGQDDFTPVAKQILDLMQP